jgi:hypothetical protein
MLIRAAAETSVVLLPDGPSRIDSPAPDKRLQRTGISISIMSTRQLKQFLYLFLLSAIALCVPTSTTNAQANPNRIVSMKAQLFYEDKGTFSQEDAAEDDHGPPYSPPKFWNTPMQYENRSTAVFVVVEVKGEGTSKRSLEFIARYIPFTRASKEIVVRRVMRVSIAIKAGAKPDHFFAGFWLYETGCNAVKLTARILGQRRTATVRKVIKFDCGE